MKYALTVPVLCALLVAGGCAQKAPPTAQPQPVTRTGQPPRRAAGPIRATLIDPTATLDPQTIEFDPSPDHNAVATDGTPLVQSYRFNVYEKGNATALRTASLGKPSPQPDGKIRYPLLTALGSPLPSTATYEARVAAVGPGGVSSDVLSNTFEFSAPEPPPPPPGVPPAAPSSLTITAADATSQTLTWTDNSGDESGFKVANAMTAATIIQLPPNATTYRVTGLQPDTVYSYVVYAQNQYGDSVASNVVTGRTQALPCTYTLAPTAATVAASGGSGSFTVTPSASTCTWTAASSAPWIAAVVQPGAVSYTVQANTSTDPRVGTITAAGQLFTVNQTGAAPPPPPPPCTYVLTPTSVSLPASGGGGSFTVASSDVSCTWSASSGASWLTVTGTSGLTVSYAASPNTATQPRAGTISVAGVPFTVTQAAAVVVSDTIPPVVRSISIRQNGNSRNYTVTVSASDNVGITRVDIALDGRIVAYASLVSGVTTSGTWSASFSVGTSGQHTLTAQARDAAGNLASLAQTFIRR